MRVATVALLLTSVASAAGTPTGVDRIAWLQGCWTMTTGERVVEEQWMAPRGGAMLGIGRTVKAGRLVEHEFMIVRERGDALVFEAHPSGQPAAEFVARHVEFDAVVFENAQHDFPQRIGYRKRSSGLDAWVEGTVSGKSRRIDFPYAREACPGN